LLRNKQQRGWIEATAASGVMKAAPWPWARRAQRIEDARERAFAARP